MSNQTFPFDFFRLYEQLVAVLKSEGPNSTFIQQVGDGFTLSNDACVRFCGVIWHWYPTNDILNRLVGIPEPSKRSGLGLTIYS